MTSFLGYQNRTQFLRTYGIIAGMSAIAFLVRMLKFSMYGLGFQVNLFLVQFISLIIIWEGLRFINRTLDRQYPYERSLTIRIAIQLSLGAVVGALARTCIYYFGEPYVPFRLDELFIAVTWFLYIVIPVVINLGFFTVYFISRWRESLIRAERLEKEKSQVQFDNLKNQINPHFLFNALTSLNSLILENQELASQFLQHLSKVYRYVLQNKDKNFVSLQTEWEFIKNYIFLAHTRFGKALRIEMMNCDAQMDRAIVPVTLQTLVENALKHNVAEEARPLTVRIFCADDYLVVENNLQKRGLVETSNKLGLDNLKSLYQFLTERPVIIESTESTFRVKVPLI